MKSTIIKSVVFVVIIAVAGAVSSIIGATANEAEEKKVEDTRPTVSIETLVPITHNVEISSFGEVMPLESTVLAAQVSGEVLSWHPNFVAGGVVKRGDVLFSIESDTYEADVLRAEAQISLAEATLTEELARQKVAMREARNLPKNQVSDLYLRKPQVISAKAQLKSAQAGLRIAKRNLAKTQVKAPYDALIVSRDIGTGQFVSSGMRVAQINNIETAEIIVPVAGFDTPFLNDSIQSTPAMVTSQGRAKIQREAFINRNLGLVDQDTRMQHLVIRIEDPYGLSSNQASLKFGTYVEVKFTGKSLDNVYKIPQSLVNKRKIWVVDDQDQLRSHAVEVIREEGSYFFISSGLEPQERLAKNLPEYPQNGMKVKVINADGVAINDTSETGAVSAMSVKSSASSL